MNNLKYDQIIKILNVLDHSINISGLRNQISAQNMYMFVRTHKHFPKSASWMDYRKEHPHLYDVPDIEKESTYMGCIDCEISLTNTNELKIIVTLFAGDSFDGHRLNKESMFVSVFPKDTDIDFEYVLGHATTQLKRMAEYQLEQEEAQRQQQLVLDRMTQLLEKQYYIKPKQ